ncbi:eye-specific diacylglycerol kinase isoform X2 [Eurytemora carolleeae]|uniref:eye-specific diacylglycerol kinase isoform X2 n=1 Tax=Eurytemora carolleeae TaxID=1294199 RepID=UPI000C78DC00|nr:eye-specific diacylglycerol kinase isoform X2 [Eurytemora carolleeae]|eukprot:XP_023345984.1 eye-specific diacylglycerol kinase-like isoform X2 [Eurytemora affinis]
MLSAPSGSSSLVPLPDQTLPLSTIRKSASDGQVVPLGSVGSRRVSNQSLPSPTEEEMVPRRGSDGEISMMENSNDDDPCSPVALGITDWSDCASPNAHIFVPTSGSVQSCYLAQDCLHSGMKFKCVACRTIAHQGCISALNSVFPCKLTFRECVRKYREQTDVHHHWVIRKQMKGKCISCHKNFQSKLGSKFSSAAVGINCSWCKLALHNSDTCRALVVSNPVCDLGVHSGIIIPPSWIIKLPRKGSFKSSIKNSPKRSGEHRLQICEKVRTEQATKVPKEHPTFLLKPIPVAHGCPVIVFLNPKSGGNQGEKLMQKFQWLLNPRQVFDLSQSGPLPAIELYKRVPGVRFLACGGDGTVGWVLSVLDKADVPSPPPVGVLPLGTGNDLSRTLGWGGGYTDEPISKILISLQHADIINVDRWQLSHQPNPEYPPSDKGEDRLPMQVVNNYFSLGVDALIALQFHEAREANPQKFNSRIRNKIFYGQTGGKDLILRKWKSLTDYIRVECDGRDITPKLRELKVLAVIFLNIHHYSSGTRPWNRQFGEQRLDDGLLEVIGVTTYQFPLLLAGGHGHCITQCQTARITTMKTIPMQVDGEAVRVNPSVIEIRYLNQAKMLVKRQSGSKVRSTGLPCALLRIGVSKISMVDYEVYHCNKDQLKSLAKPFGELNVESTADLEQVRSLVRKLQENNIGPVQSKLQSEWCFLDSVTAERFFRVDRAQENLHFLPDICENTLYILETEEIVESNLSNLLPEDLMTPPRSPLTPIPGDPLHEDRLPTTQPSSDNELLDEEENHQKRVGALKERGGIDASVPTFGLTPPDDDSLKTTDGILKAARLGDLKMLRELCTEGYSLLSRDETGKTALHYGARFGHKEIIKFLVMNGPPTLIDMTDYEKGHTALHKAAAYKRRTICCMLVTAGANLIIEDSSGKTAQQLALSAEDDDLSAYLESQELFQTSNKDFETQV